MRQTRKHWFAALVGGATALSGFAWATAEEPPRAPEQQSHREPTESRSLSGRVRSLFGRRKAESPRKAESGEGRAEGLKTAPTQQQPRTIQQVSATSSGPQLSTLDPGPSFGPQLSTPARRDSEALDPQPSSLTLDALEQLARENNPTLGQAAAIVEAARGRQIQAGLYPNPFVGYTGSEIGNDGRGGQQGVVIGQEIVRGGKLMLSSAVAGYEREQAEAQAAAQMFRVLNAVRSSFYETLAAERTLGLTRELMKLAEQGVSVASQREKAGEGTLTEVLQAQIELEQVRIFADNASNNYRGFTDRVPATVNVAKQQLRDELIRRVAERVVEVTKTYRPDQRAEANVRELSNIAAVTGISKEQAAKQIAPLLDSTEELLLNEMRKLDVEQENPAADLQRGIAELAPEAALDRILAMSPEVSLAEAGVRRAEAAVVRARVEPIPNVTLEAGTQYDFGSSTQIANVGVSFPIPIRNRNQGNILAAESELTRAQREVDRVKLSLAGRFAAVYARFRNAQQQVDRYGRRLPDDEVKRILSLAGEERQKELDKYPQILPRAQVALALATEGWRRGEFGYLQVLTAQRTLAQASLGAVRAQAELRQNAVVLDGYLLTDGLGDPGAGGAGSDQ